MKNGFREPNRHRSNARNPSVAQTVSVSSVAMAGAQGKSPLSGIGEGNRADQRAHPIPASRPCLGQGQGHHYRQGQPDPCRHPAPAAQEVPLEPEVVVEATVDPFQRTATPVASFPGRAAVGGRSEEAPILGGQGNPYDATESPRLRACRPVTAFPAGTVKPIGRRRAAVLQRPPLRLKALERQAPLRAGFGTDAAHFPFFGMHDGIGPVRIQRSRDPLGGVVARLLLLLLSQLPGFDQGTNAVVVP